MNKIRIIFAAVFLSAVFILPLAFAQSSEPIVIWGGNTIQTAGEITLGQLDSVFTLEEDVVLGEKVFFKLPVLKPGEGMKVDITNSDTVPYKRANGEIVRGKDGSWGKVHVEDETGKQYCTEHWFGYHRNISCNVGTVSSDKEKYQLYLIVEGYGSADQIATSKDIMFTIKTFERYDEALRNDDVPNKIKNALAIEPGEYSGYLGNGDLDDYYKIDGLTDGATVNLSVTFSINEGSPKRDDGKFGGFFYLNVKTYDEKKKEITYLKSGKASVYHLKPDEEEILEIPVKVEAETSGSLVKKVPRYFQFSFDCSASCYSGQVVNYNLNLEVKGLKREFTSGGESANCSGFRDVSATDQRCAAVSLMKEKGVMRGTGDGTQFEGSKVLNRAELAATIVKFMGETPASNDELGDLARFVDISEKDRGQWYVGPLRTAMSLGMVNGFPDRTMRPADPVNKAQFVLIFARAKDVELPQVTEAPAKDVSATSDATAWYRGAVKFAVDNGFVDLSQGYFYPNASVSRFEVADLLYRWFTAME